MSGLKKTGLGSSPNTSLSTRFIQNRNTIPQVSGIMANTISEERRVILSSEVDQGKFLDGSGPTSNQLENMYGSSGIGNLVASKRKISTIMDGFSKYGQAAGTGGPLRNNHGNTVKQTPEVYSPLWLNSNLNLPRDRATINAWCRSFFALNPFVHNAISLHSTYPISKLSIKCPNKDIEKFFNDLIEEIDLMNVCIQIAQEYWLLGEAFVYAELDEGKGKWSRLHIQNPDFMIVKRTVIASEPIIMLRPDQNLKNIIFSNRPNDIEQRKQLNQHIIDSVRRGENIPLDNFNVSHLARRISPYETRGTGLPVCCFRQLMLFDKLYESKYAQADNMINPLTLIKLGSENYKPGFADLEAWRDVFECHDEETEVLTDQGFKKYNEVIEYQEAMDGTTGQSHIMNAAPSKDLKIACFNPNNEQLEYHAPLNASLYNYSGEMYHFANEKMDIKVTPNHKMYISKKEYEYHGHRSSRQTKWGNWKKVEAQDVSLSDYSRFRSKINWVGDDTTFKHINILGQEVPVELYLEFLGYVLSEGCLYTNNKHQNTVGICQTFDKFQDEMSKCVAKISNCINKSYGQSIKKNNCWSATFSGKEIYSFFKEEVQDNQGRVKCYYKQMPQWVKTLSPRLLNILLKALVMGDGSTYDNPKKQSNRFAYYSTSKQLADDVYEIAYKCGYVPTMFVRDDKEYLKDNKQPLYTVLWSNSGKGEFPLVYKTSRNSQTKEKHNLLTKEQYNGKVWCFEVPTGLFITRRKGKITIQGNSAQYDKDFKIFTHEGVTVERVGWGSGIYDIGPDIIALIKQIWIGLFVPPVMMDGGSDTTYANAGVALDVLRQRYMSFRNKMSFWLKNKIFAPISKIQGFYDYSGGEKQLIVPEIDWNHMSLFDAGDYINTLVTLTQGQADQKRASLTTMYRSLGLEYEDEIRKMRKENIQNAIAKKEIAALEKMDLNSLRSLDDEDEIPELQPVSQGSEQPVPGESSGGDASSAPDLGLGGGGALPPLPSPPLGGPGGAPPGPPPGGGGTPPGNSPVG